MKKRNRVGLGTFPLAGVFSKVSKNEAKEIVQKFLELGGYYIDTAPLYGFGEVDELLGEVLKDVDRDKYFLITKCGIVGIEDKEKRKSGKYDDVILECYKSLERLGIDFIDLYLVHSPDPNTPFDETIAALQELKDEGKIKQVGVSNVSLDELEAYNATGMINYVQNRFSLINRSIDLDFESYLKKHQIAFIPYEVLEQGQLTKDVVYGSALRKGDLRLTLPEWEKYRLQMVVDWERDELKPIADDLGIVLSQLAIAWALHQPFVSFPIVGATNLKQVESNMKANDIRLSKKILDRIDDAYERLRLEILDKYNLEVHEFRGLNEKYY